VHKALLKGYPGFHPLIATIARWRKRDVHRLLLTEQEAVRVEHLLAAIEDEMRHRRLHRKEAVAAEFMEFIVILARVISEQRVNNSPSAQADILTETLLEYIESHLSENLTVRGIASQIGYSEDYLSHQFKCSAGMRLGQYIALQRIRKAEQRLQEDEATTVLDIALEAGFSSLRTFNRCFKRFTGMTPRAYQRYCLSHRR
jgi:AraC-like DNA-binding protein